jgi:hypothetical protein
MDVVHTHCAGLDVHEKTVVAAMIVPERSQGWHRETRPFGTTTGERLALSDWLTAHGVTHGAMESTGEYWKPVFNIVEHAFEALLVNAPPVKAVPGRKTAINDAPWIAELLSQGLLKASFVPPAGQRELRELTRARSTLVRERATRVNRVRKVLESAKLKLAGVASDGLGASGRAMLDALIAGHASPDEMAQWAQGRMRGKRELLTQALDGRVKPHHRFILTELLCPIDSLEETLSRFNERIEEDGRRDPRLRGRSRHEPFSVRRAPVGMGGEWPRGTMKARARRVKATERSQRPGSKPPALRTPICRRSIIAWAPAAARNGRFWPSRIRSS